MEPQDRNQQQQHLLETNPRRRVTDRRSLGTDQDGPAVLQHRARRRSHGSPRRCSCQTSPREALDPGGARTHEADATGCGTGTHDPPTQLRRKRRRRVRTARAPPRAFASRELWQKKSLAHEQPPVHTKSIIIRASTSGHVYQNKPPRLKAAVSLAHLNHQKQSNKHVSAPGP